ncbi:hypothetical protein A1O1_02867 [Capronia coronata CBS 617.96]|uniref:Zn(2)-C6 fungal-type domain-containing protein n=1 Tax=Capronia coronata CBS 617.96 TaxID=1182541 RepID=W9YYW4_9EURO|nr:uncharacterized protein A1O1_02867 [Capronia coronata CBS 617.96]EXJ94471.1 hypothetical protein A1O1_02867 [Capronia coronata CBS 617.96]
MDPTSRRVPVDKRKRTETSCDKCKARKQKCDRLLNEAQCRYCELHGYTCTTTALRKRRAYGLEGMGSRITLLESLVKGLLPEANLSSIDEIQHVGASLGIPLPALEDNILTENAQGTRGQGTDDDDEEATVEVIPDQQNQTQYVGPSSSFLFHLKLRRMLGAYSIFKFALFGNNAADQIAEPPRDVESSHNARRESASVATDCSSPADAVREIDEAVIEALMDAYFEVIHPDFPVIHEASFRASYEAWAASNSTADPAWLCGALCILILSRRVAPIEIPEEAEKKWWRHVQALLPTVIFSSNISTIQALMLAALHLHNTNHRDACWNLTGAAVRVAHAIGMHRDDIKQTQNRLNRELRRLVWWTLYAFEQMQVSSYDRPSAIAHVASTVDCPNERIVGNAGAFPPDFALWSRKLTVILGMACKALNPGNGGAPSPEDAYSRPLSPTATILRDLARWKQGLPTHLRVEVLDSLAPSTQRPLILLHVQYYYILVLVTRTALLRHANIIVQNKKADQQAVPPALVMVSDTSIDAGRSLGQLLRRLDSIHRFNAVTWFDVFYLVAAALVLVLDLRINRGEATASSTTSESRLLLQDLASLASKHMQNHRMPGSMRALAQIVVDVNSTAEQFTSSTSTATGAAAAVTAEVQQQPQQSLAGTSAADGEPQMGGRGLLSQGQRFAASGTNSPAPTESGSPFESQVLPQHDHNNLLATAPLEFHRPTTAPGSGKVLDSIRSRAYDSEFWAQFSFMDEVDTGNGVQDWVWDDIGTIVRGG